MIHAISGIEIALRDIFGKATAQPLHRLFGGAQRARIRAYASTLMPDTADQALSLAAEQREAGFTALKLGYGPLGRDADLDVALVQAAGEKCDLMIDVGLGRTNARAMTRVKRMEEFRPYWIEAPFMPDEYAKYTVLADSVDRPLAAGEQESSAQEGLRAATRCRRGDPAAHVTRVGGCGECLRVAALAQRTRRRCVLHAWSTGIIKVATVQRARGDARAELFEYCIQDSALNRRPFSGSFPVIDGYVSVPTGPGLGIEVDEEVVDQCRLEASL